VGPDDLRVIPYLLGRTSRDLFTVIDRHNVVAEAHDNRDVVFHYQDRCPLAMYAPDGVQGEIGLFLAHTADGFVKEKQLGLYAQGGRMR